MVSEVTFLSRSERLGRRRGDNPTRGLNIFQDCVFYMFRRFPTLPGSQKFHTLAAGRAFPSAAGPRILVALAGSHPEMAYPEMSPKCQQNINAVAYYVKLPRATLPM